ncbi:TraR/DksA C4-type zinc finger protein [Selenihalanaerobacter shriftii]|uniref:Transcriptional regulator, TraR/DksA family n=1 Tax=Selenihalanaerobacter shriftii TaxID=142842 RepID=A0A1T4QFT2_9FIRM|nr:TraR/DksA C4-type zinc finger protein [Selenihalanaerobacter shriftii]SKA02650.1 transcriptional regulator, TraR/DksA family [Selenihalanaerobacter shriftii]
MYQDNEHYKRQLLREKQRLLEQIENIDDTNYTGLGHSVRESTSELSNYDNHPADQALNTYEREKDLGLRDNAYQLLKQVEDALEQIESGNYGVCESCGQSINEERLDIMPYTTYCAECREKYDMAFETTDRPVEEDVLEPYGRAFNDNTGDVGFDGEDSWQAVAQYGTSNTPSDVADAVEQADVYIDSNEAHGSVDWTDRVSDQGFTTGDEEFDDENIVSWQPTTGAEELEDIQALDELEDLGEMEEVEKLEEELAEATEDEFKEEMSQGADFEEKFEWKED